MSPERVSGSEVVGEFSEWGVGLGILVVQLFPLSIPIVLLTAVALLVLALPLIAIGLLAGLAALPVVLVRRLRRRVARTPALIRPAEATSLQIAEAHASINGREEQ